LVAAGRVRWLDSLKPKANSIALGEYYSVSQCSWATFGFPRLGKNEKGLTIPAIVHKAADQPEVQYHCTTL
jgi:hypothetical protein